MFTKVNRLLLLMYFNLLHDCWCIFFFKISNIVMILITTDHLDHVPFQLYCAHIHRSCRASGISLKWTDGICFLRCHLLQADMMSNGGMRTTSGEYCIASAAQTGTLICLSYKRNARNGIFSKKSRRKKKLSKSMTAGKVTANTVGVCASQEPQNTIFKLAKPMTDVWSPSDLLRPLLP